MLCIALSILYGFFSFNASIINCSVRHLRKQKDQGLNSNQSNLRVQWAKPLDSLGEGGRLIYENLNKYSKSWLLFLATTTVNRLKSVYSDLSLYVYMSPMRNIILLLVCTHRSLWELITLFQDSSPLPIPWTNYSSLYLLALFLDVKLIPKFSLLQEYFCIWGFPGGSVSCQCRTCGFDPWVGKILWRRKWQPTLVFLPGKSHGQRNLVGYSPWGGKRVGHDLTNNNNFCTMYLCSHMW